MSFVIGPWQDMKKKKKKAPFITKPCKGIREETAVLNMMKTIK